MQPEDDTRLGTPPEARHPDEKPPRSALTLVIGLIIGCAIIAALLLWWFGNVPSSG